MDFENNIEIGIQRYLDGDMDPGAQREFEERLQSDPEMQNQLESYKTLIKGIRFQKRNEAWDLVAELETEAQEKRTRSRGGKKTLKFLLVAASVLILFLFLAILYNGLKIGGINDRLVAEHFEPYPVLANGPVRGGDNLESLKERAYLAYGAERYEEAITLLTRLVDEQYDVYDAFYLGNAHLASGNYMEAIGLFQELAETDILLKVQTQWYLSLSHLGNNDVDRAKAIFTEIGRSDTSYSDKATQILNNL